jgi:hypothetical protein
MWLGTLHNYCICVVIDEAIMGVEVKSSGYLHAGHGL